VHGGNPQGRPGNAQGAVPSTPIISGGLLRSRDPRWPAHEFAEADYRYGKGPLRLRVVRVEWARSIACEGDTWLETEAVEVDDDGREGAHRQLLIRAERLPAPLARKRPRLRV
jgi:hypothetical protein